MLNVHWINQSADITDTDLCRHCDQVCPQVSFQTGSVCSACHTSRRAANATENLDFHVDDWLKGTLRWLLIQHVRLNRAKCFISSLLVRARRRAFTVLFTLLLQFNHEIKRHQYKRKTVWISEENWTTSGTKGLEFHLFKNANTEMHLFIHLLWWLI